MRECRMGLFFSILETPLRQQHKCSWLQLQFREGKKTKQDPTKFNGNNLGSIASRVGIFYRQQSTHIEYIQIPLKPPKICPIMFWLISKPAGCSQGWLFTPSALPKHHCRVIVYGILDSFTTFPKN